MFLRWTVMSKYKKTKTSHEKFKRATVKNEIGYENAVPVWMFDKIDRNGKFAFDLKRKDFEYCEFLDKMIAYTTMTWSRLRKQTHDDGKSKHHYLEAGKLSKDAQKRLEAMHLEENSDQIFSMALRNKLRIVGLRDRDKFHILWYDPQHEVYPSTKAHT